MIPIIATVWGLRLIYQYTFWPAPESEDLQVMLRDVTNTGSLNTCVPHKQTLVLTELLPTPNKQIILLDRWTTLKVLNIIVAIMLMFISFVGLHQWGKERIKISSNCDFWLSPPTTQIYSFCSYLLNKSLLFPLSHCFVISYEISRLVGGPHCWHCH